MDSNIYGIRIYDATGTMMRFETDQSYRELMERLTATMKQIDPAKIVGNARLEITTVRTSNFVWTGEGWR